MQDWFQGVGLLTFLRDVGKFARVGTMLSRDAVKSRMELDNEGISYTECATNQSSAVTREARWAPLCSAASILHACLSSLRCKNALLHRRPCFLFEGLRCAAGSPINFFRGTITYISIESMGYGCR